jgi:hypothetical protein
MSAVCVLTPLVVASWPAVSAAIAGAAAALGFAIQPPACAKKEVSSETVVETTIPNSEVIAEQTGPGQRIVVQRGDITITFGQNQRGACTVCVSGAKHSTRALRRIGEEVAGRVVQQFAYHKLVSELKRHHYAVVDEQMLQDQSVRVRVRLQG